ncbi:hypothetical protein [Rhodohalobacter mucosus]|uniref:Uncharacterized protein n=1 Tax=Rhodohalobacter mucosus TaxID=2079485 RepID=A0A316U1Y6_9BACT|nr:hypothetical protein [Rhodohalobacter mucosus]PWN07076.1 hypothetical protein DDZ15_07350 [Rhodohalobacter mucosus]
MNQICKYRFLVVISFLFLILSGFTIKPTSGEDLKITLASNVSFLEVQQSTSALCNASSIYLSEARDCVIRVKTDDMDIELTLHDVGWWDCTKLKLKALWEFGF